MKLFTFLLISLALCGQTLINSGGPAVSGYSADFGFSGGATWGPANQASMGTLPGIYQTLRYSTNNSGFGYDLVEPAGQCDVTLDLLEPNKTAIGQRAFTVSANGNKTGQIDVFQLAGGALIPHQLVIPGVWVLDGHLRIVFTPLNGKGNAIVSGIEARCHPPLSLNCIAPISCTQNQGTVTIQLLQSPTAAIEHLDFIPISSTDRTIAFTLSHVPIEGFPMVYEQNIGLVGCPVSPTDSSCPNVAKLAQINRTGANLAITLPAPPFFDDAFIRIGYFSAD